MGIACFSSSALAIAITLRPGQSDRYIQFRQRRGGEPAGRRRHFAPSASGEIYDQPSGADYYLGCALAEQGKYEEAAVELQRAKTLNGEMQQRAWYELSQAYRHFGKPAKSHAGVQKFEALKQAGDQAKSAGAEDWRKLDAASSAAPAEKVQQ
jgi:hypothetical protein